MADTTFSALNRESGEDENAGLLGSSGGSANAYAPKASRITFHDTAQKDAERQAREAEVQRIEGANRFYAQNG